jgi:hypothetical protein
MYSIWFYVCLESYWKCLVFVTALKDSVKIGKGNQVENYKVDSGFRLQYQYLGQKWKKTVD